LVLARHPALLTFAVRRLRLGEQARPFLPFMALLNSALRKVRSPASLLSI
jgi:hypothetical protein